MPDHTKKEKKKQPKTAKKSKAKPKTVKGGAKGESLHKRATDPREARPALLGLPNFFQKVKRA